MGSIETLDEQSVEGKASLCQTFRAQIVLPSITKAPFCNSSQHIDLNGFSKLLGHLQGF